MATEPISTIPWGPHSGYFMDSEICYFTRSTASIMHFSRSSADMDVFLDEYLNSVSIYILNKELISTDCGNNLVLLLSSYLIVFVVTLFWMRHLPLP